ncbi:hypothetical protein KGQ20_42600, partial [Catenulispora sp. NF23]|uniref:hypothetical protein n=1 Tax=Catenulispora pinistramenti TaxID=2705254 RepID=UPI001BA6EE70
MVVPVRGSGRRVCLSAAGLRVHDPAPPQASSTPAGQNKGTGKINRTSKIKSQSKIKNQSKIKSCDEEPAPPAGALGSLGELAR